MLPRLFILLHLLLLNSIASFAADASAVPTHHNGFLFDIKHANVNGRDVFYLKKSATSGIVGGCGIEAVLNCFPRVNWSSHLGKSSLHTFSQLSKTCVDAKQSHDMWVAPEIISRAVEEVTVSLCSQGVDLGDLNDNKVSSLQTSDVISFLAPQLADVNPVIAQAMHGCHFIAYRPIRPGLYYKIDAYHGSVELKKSHQILHELQGGVASGKITSLHVITKK